MGTAGCGVFNWTNSTDYPDTEQVNVSWTGGIDDMPPCSGLGSFSRIMDRDTGDLTVVANNVCIGVNRAEVSYRQPFGGRCINLTPAGMVALIGMLCIAGTGRIAKKGGMS